MRQPPIILILVKGFVRPLGVKAQKVLIINGAISVAHLNQLVERERDHCRRS